MIIGWSLTHARGFMNTERSLETRLFINRPYKVIDLMGGGPVEGVVVGDRLVCSGGCCCHCW